ncbi:MAG: MarR family winged helix-turn-helix transcriptional regulator [Trebonia sp.]
MNVQPGQVPSTGWLIWQVALRCRRLLDQALAPLGLTSAQYGLLASLCGLSLGGARPSQRQLADFAGLEPMYVSKLARTLEQAGLVERRGDPGDTRAVQLSLTVAGTDLVAAAREVVIALDEQMLSPFGGRPGARAASLRDEMLTLLRHLDQEEHP